VKKRNDHKQFYFVGAGLGSMTGAAFLIRDCGFDGKNIHIIEALPIEGGSNDASGNADTGYICRGERMFNRQTYENFWDIMSSIPSLTYEGNSVTDDMFEFSTSKPCFAKARLLDSEGEIMDSSSYGLSSEHLKKLVFLMTASEEDTTELTIVDWFDDESFYTTNYWWMYSTTFAFQPWSSLTEFRRYNLRFLHLITRLNTAKGVTLTEMSQYDSVIRPLKVFLDSEGVDFIFDTAVTDLSFKDGNDITVTEICYNRNNTEGVIHLNEGDCCVVTLGCMTDNASIGSSDKKPVFEDKVYPKSAQLWMNIAMKRENLGNPDVFFAHPDQSNWITFNCTFKGTTLMDWLEKYTHNKTGEGLITTFTGSPWCLTMRNPLPPYFPNQPEDVTFLWVTSLYCDKPGNYVTKPMTECSGNEILEEILRSLPLSEEERDKIKSEVVAAIPVMLPYAGAHFLSRKTGDRPQVVPEGSTNLGLIGQYVEIPEDVVFTEEYSVRGARTAVYKLLGMKREVAPVKPIRYDARILLASTVAFLK
jgi:oleate hydratase